MSLNQTEQVVPFVDLALQTQRLRAEIDSALASVLDSASFVMGPAVEEFETAFAAFCQAKHCVTVHSGTAALHLALLSLGVGPGDEVITCPNSFVATAEAIFFAGASVRFVDVDPVTYTLDPSKLEEAITPSTKAIIPVHLYGQAADMDAISAIAASHGLSVLEDACQAHGARYKGRLVGSLADAACFSFYPAKNLGALGDGGAVVTDSSTIAEKVRLLRDHGSKQKYQHEIIGHNFRFDSVQAAVLNVKLAHLSAWNEMRRELAAYYSDNLKELPGIITPTVAEGREAVFHLYVLQAKNRLELEKTLAESGIRFGIHYPRPIHLQPAFAQLGLKEGQFPVSEQLSNSVISLPIYPELTRQQQDRVIDAVLKATSKTSI